MINEEDFDDFTDCEGSSLGDLRAELDKANEKIKGLEAANTFLYDEITQLQIERDSLSRKLEDANAEISWLKDDLKHIMLELKAANDELKYQHSMALERVYDY